MKNIKGFLFICLSFTLIIGCHRKTVPAHARSTVTVTTKKSPGETPGSPASASSSSASKTKTTSPTVIVVNDNVAKKTIDGRYYYDLNGKRYWKNNKDGKYYLFNKSMYNNPDFKPKR